MGFVTMPLVAWLVCGTIKFLTNMLRHGYDAFNRIGHGGFPSNHTAIVSSVLWMFLLTGAWPMAGLVLAVLMIHVFDATGLRREIGRHAATINELTGSHLREITGHNGWDISGGLAVGLLVAATYWTLGVLP
jgi:acid phosphatase family membrane protein YuiD